MEDSYTRRVTLHCPVCGDTKFSWDDDETENDEYEMTCSRCGYVTTNSKLVEQNDALIEAEIDDVTNELLADISKRFNKTFKIDL